MAIAPPFLPKPLRLWSLSIGATNDASDMAADENQDVLVFRAGVQAFDYLHRDRTADVQILQLDNTVAVYGTIPTVSVSPTGTLSSVEPGAVAGGGRHVSYPFMRRWTQDMAPEALANQMLLVWASAIEGAITINAEVEV